MICRATASIGALLLLSACTVPGAGGQQAASTQALVSQEPYSQLVFQQDMYTAGAEYGSAMTHPAPNRAAVTVKQCYDSVGTLQFSTYQRHLRRCMVMDYVAYKDDQAATHNGQVPGNPFFERESVLRRWTADSPRAGFSTPDEMFQFMRTGYAYLKPMELQVLKTHNQQIFVQPQLGQRPSLLPGEQM